MKSETVLPQELDREWLALIIEAKNLGMELATIKEFLNKNKSVLINANN